MTYYKEHPVLFSLGSIVVISMAVVSVIYTMGMYSVEAAKINAEKSIKETEIREHEATERTEERSQFWQSLIPWGSDEAEKGE